MKWSTDADCLIPDRHKGRTLTLRNRDATGTAKLSQRHHLLHPRAIRKNPSREAADRVSNANRIQCSIRIRDFKKRQKGSTILKQLLLLSAGRTPRSPVILDVSCSQVLCKLNQVVGSLSLSNTSHLQTRSCDLGSIAPNAQLVGGLSEQQLHVTGE